MWDLESLVSWKGPELVRLTRGLLRDPHQAEDVVQDVLARCVLKWSRVQAVEDPSAYLNRMVVNAVVSHHRRPWRRERVSDPAELPDVPVHDDGAGYGDRQHYLALLRRLPDARRPTPDGPPSSCACAKACPTSRSPTSCAAPRPPSAATPTAACAPCVASWTRTPPPRRSPDEPATP